MSNNIRIPNKRKNTKLLEIFKQQQNRKQWKITENVAICFTNIHECEIIFLVIFQWNFR